MKTLLIGLSALLLGGAGLLATGPLDGAVSEPPTLEIDPTAAPSSSSTTTTTTNGTTTTPTTTSNGTTTTPSTTTTTEAGEDIPGPCDEAEHANDPRCTGTGARDDRRGGRDDDRGGDDRSGPNRGPGGGDDDHGGDDRGGDEDRSGSNSGSG